MPPHRFTSLYPDRKPPEEVLLARRRARLEAEAREREPHWTQARAIQCRQSDGLVLAEGSYFIDVFGEVFGDYWDDWPAGGVHIWYSHDGGITWRCCGLLREPSPDRRRGPRPERPDPHDLPPAQGPDALSSAACGRPQSGRQELGDAEPTTAPPGSPEKVEVLVERARRRQPLFHPDDAVDCAAGLTKRRTGWSLGMPRPLEPAGGQRPAPRTLSSRPLRPAAGGSLADGQQDQATDEYHEVPGI
jgi:hypothetical protein